MSRIGKLPVPVPSGVKVTVENQTVTVTGPKGTLRNTFHPAVIIKHADGKIVVERKSDDKKEKALHGLTRTLIANMVRGVSQGYQKSLVMTGMGYRVAKQGNNVVLNIGFSHPVVIKPIAGIELDVEGNNKIVIRGSDKQQVGQVAANLRGIRPPDSYKGKGILYEGERLKLKVGKAGKGATGK